MARDRSFWIELVRIVANAVIATLTALGVASCVSFI